MTIPSHTRWSRAIYTVVLAALTLTSPLSAQSLTVDPTRLPLGDSHLSRGPQVGSLWSCQTTFTGGGAFQNGPWIHSDGTYDVTTKAIVPGAIEWASEMTIEVDGGTRVISGNGLPNHTTGIYPIANNSEAARYDRNPNSISPQSVHIELPGLPQVAPAASCAGGTVGILVSGGALFNSVDAEGRDAVAHEAQDACGGHPERTGQYHYHALSPCIPDDGDGHSVLVGYALDGFGIYGFRGEDGVAVSNADLDECHGHTHPVDWDGETVELYHYHATLEFPYTVGCYRGSSAASRQLPPPGSDARPGGPTGQQPPPGGPPSGGPPPPRR